MMFTGMEVSDNHRESGQISVLIIGCVTIMGLLAVVVINASAAFVHRQRLADLADGAALAGAQAIQSQQVYLHGVTTDLPLDSSRARRAIVRYMESSGVSFTVLSTSDSVTVELDDYLELPLAPPGWAKRTRVTAKSTALLRAH